MKNRKLGMLDGLSVSRSSTVSDSGGSIAVGVMRLLIALSVLSAALVAPGAHAAIVKFQPVKSCQVNGLDEADSVQGGVHCDNGNPFSLTEILNGGLALWVGDSQTPSWNIINDTGESLDTLTMYFFGGLASNSSIDMQISGTDVFESCTATTADNVITSDSDCGSEDKTAENPALALMMEWSGGDGLGAGHVFNLGTSSFAHAGQDAGCFSGTFDCLPPRTTTMAPEPKIVALLGLGLLGIWFGRRRRVS